MRCSVRYRSACKWKALPFFLQDLQFPSARDFLWGTANPAAKEACCFHWLFCFWKTSIQWHPCPENLTPLLAKGKGSFCYAGVSVISRCNFFFFNLHKILVNPTFYIIASVHPPWHLAPQGKKYRQAWGLSCKQANIPLLPLQASVCVVGSVGAALQVRLALSVDPWLQGGCCFFSVSLRRGLWSRQQVLL